MRAKLLLAAAFVCGCGCGDGGGGGRELDRCGWCSGTPAIDLYHSASVRVSGITARSAQVRPVGAIDRAGIGVRVEALSLAGAPGPGRHLARPAAGAAALRDLPAAAPLRPRPEGSLVPALAAACVSPRNDGSPAVSDGRRRRPRLRSPSPGPPDSGRVETVAARELRPSRRGAEPAVRDRLRAPWRQPAQLAAGPVRLHGAQRLPRPLARPRSHDAAIRLRSGR